MATVAILNSGGQYKFTLDNEVYYLETKPSVVFNKIDSTVDFIITTLKGNKYINDVPIANITIGGTLITSESVLDTQMATVFLSAGSSALTTEYKAILAKLAVKPIKRIQKLQNTCIVNLKAAGVWDKLACFIPYCAGMTDAGDALFWWNNPDRKATLSGTAPSYLAGNGFTGNGTSAYINTTFNPSLDGADKYTQNDNSSGYWFRNLRTTPAATGSGLVITDPGSAIYPLYSTNLGYWRQQSTYMTFVNAQVNGMYTTVRK